jgi:phosphinothricin acetyltransferase
VAEVRIRLGCPSDLAGILGIYNHYVAHSPATFEVAPLRPEDRREWLDDHLEGGPHRLVVADADPGGVRGYATTSAFIARAAYATTVQASVYCHPESRGQGLGSRLYQGLFDAIQAEDLERIVAGVALPNPASVALHRRFGFRPVGTFSRVGRKFGQYWDVEWFERPARLAPDHSVEMPDRM